ncbi:uncharacterized protein LOC135393490 [Ornithodoros turicata]|uniref:uncharacterized protein LOC135393490 n=1 Tax=Ornithodoros turicata TaxID=34597 RepID=UPI0031394FA1
MRFSTSPSTRTAAVALLLATLIVTSPTPGSGAAGVVEWAAQASDFLAPLRSMWKRASLRDSPVYYVSTFLRPKQPPKPAADIFSPLFKLPIQFMSNARPLEVVKGLSKQTLTKPFNKKNLYQNSKMFYLPLKFLANGKPNRRVIIKPRSFYLTR